jgi:octaprenyl-diphosphate synthase
VRQAIEQGGKADLEAWSRRSDAVGALDYARRSARAEADVAIEPSEGIPDSACRDSLLQLAHFSVERKF